MRCLLLTIFIVVSFPAIAQFKGGNSDGFAVLAVSSQNSLANTYSGGSGDGFFQSATINQNPLTALYAGGGNDGTALLISVVKENPLSTIYNGGLNDGIAVLETISQNTLGQIYTGGNNDGFYVVQNTNQNSLPSVYSGGPNDGFTSLSSLAQNSLGQIYTGGADDGFEVVVSLQQNASSPNPNPINPLPVELLSFNAEWFNDDAVLAWQTANEKDLDHFELQRSDDMGSSFQFIAPISPNTLSGSQKDYRYVDARAYYLPNSVLLYRLKCIQKGTGFKYSAIARLSKDKSQPIIVVYPNPTSGHFTLAMLNVEDLKGYGYMLTSVEGKIIQRGVISERNSAFDLSEYAAATYHLFIIKGDKQVQHFTILLTR